MNLDMPPHYDLHVWVWQANPAGIFAPFNPNVSCLTTQELRRVHSRIYRDFKLADKEK